ncbi:DNA polymerase III subunit gamma/tau [Bacillaceae bacterium S4-13-58]
MSYQALYRVWRPQIFSDVVGQTHITRTLKNALYQQKFSHAYLFSGPRGTGKTSAAKIFSKAVNCERAPVKEPCNECDSCRGIQDGSISDVIEIDAASNNGVEQIRDIRDKVKYAPSSVPYKVYIIDEVHMLSIGAFNALLKTLEEPPKHVIFILATTEPHKIPLTIISRCQRFDFRRITPESIVGRMKTIIENENIHVQDEALHAVALAAEGGMRDALSILDQAISYSEEEVTLEDVLAVTGSVSQKRLTQLVDSLFHKNANQALQTVDELIQSGKDPGRFVFDMIYYLRDLLLFKSAPNIEGILDRAIPDEEFKTLAQTVNENWIQQSITELNRCQQEMKWTHSSKVFIEISVLNICNQENQQESLVDSPAIEKLVLRLNELEQELTNLKTQGVMSNSETQEQESKRVTQRAQRSHFKVPIERIRQVLHQASKQELKHVASQWAAFMDNLKQNSPPAHATLLNSKPRAASSDTVVISFRYEIHCSLAMENKPTIESLLAKAVGKQLSIVPVPDEKWAEIREDFLKNQQSDTSSNEEPQHEDPIIVEARKLVGEDLLEIKDR